MEDKLFDSLDRYFTTLSYTGYRKQCDVDKLLILSFINDFLNSDAADFITEEDYKYINRALYCFYGSSCLIPYYISNTDYLATVDGSPLLPRFLEDTNTMFTEDGNVRFKDIGQ